MTQRRLALRRRLEGYADFARRRGRINRKDMAKIGEISFAQASSDMKALIEDYPDLGLAYDPSKKTYIVKGKT